MRLVPLDDIRMAVEIKLTVLPKPAKRHLGMDATYEREVVEAVMSALRGCVVVAPSMVGSNAGGRHGVFGVDEPHPFPDLLPGPHRPGKSE